MSLDFQEQWYHIFLSLAYSAHLPIAQYASLRCRDGDHDDIVFECGAMFVEALLSDILGGYELLILRKVDECSDKGPFRSVSPGRMSCI